MSAQEQDLHCTCIQLPLRLSFTFEPRSYSFSCQSLPKWDTWLLAGGGSGLQPRTERSAGAEGNRHQVQPSCCLQLLDGNACLGGWSQSVRSSQLGACAGSLQLHKQSEQTSRTPLQLLSCC